MSRDDQSIVIDGAGGARHGRCKGALSGKLCYGLRATGYGLRRREPTGAAKTLVAIAATMPEALRAVDPNYRAKAARA